METTINQDPGVNIEMSDSDGSSIGLSWILNAVLVKGPTINDVILG